MHICSSPALSSAGLCALDTDWKALRTARKKEWRVIGGGLLVFKRGGREKNVGREDRQGGEDWGRGGRDNGACVWGGLWRCWKLCEGGVNFHFIHPSIEFLRLRCLDLPFLTLHFQFFKRGHRKRWSQIIAAPLWPGLKGFLTAAYAKNVSRWHSELPYHLLLMRICGHSEALMTENNWAPYCNCKGWAPFRASTCLPLVSSQLWWQVSVGM